MSTFLERLEREFEELEVKYDKLDMFINSPNFKDVDEFQKSLLKIQAAAMATYYGCLKERIKYLKLN